MTEEWNGSNWTEVGDLNVGRQFFAGAGTTTNAIATGGQTPSGTITASTEEWSPGSNVVKTLTD